MKIANFFSSFLTPFNIIALIIFLGIAWLRAVQNQQRHTILEQNVIAINDKIAAVIDEVDIYFADKNAAKLITQKGKIVMESPSPLIRLRKVVDELEKGPKNNDQIRLLAQNAIDDVFINQQTAFISLDSNWLADNGGLSVEILAVCSIVKTVLQDNNLDKVRFITSFPSHLNLNREFSQKDC